VTRSLDKNTLRTRMRTLRRQLAEQTPDAAERAARKLGMVASGEGSYVVRGLNR
jgi:cell division protein FtsB